MNIMNMKYLLVATAIFGALTLSAQEYNEIPYDWKWVGDHEAALTYDGSFTGEKDYSIDAKTYKKTYGISYPKPTSVFPFQPDGAENLTYSPDSTKMAFTRDNNLWVVDIATRKETQLTADGSDVILNGYASWVYYEEIFGRPSRYRAFWWSPDSKKIGFYRFDNSLVPVFPIYSAYPENFKGTTATFGYGANAGGAVNINGMSPTGGSVRMTRYPKCGDPNPKVRIGIADVASAEVVWADFDENEDQYFGTPFWGADSKEFFIQREPRVQNTLDLYAVSVADGSKKQIYHETYKTWLDWIDGMIFGRDGLYMARSFETGWDQIYYLSYDGKVLKRLTSGENWRLKILKVNEGRPSKKFDGSSSEVIFTAQRDCRWGTTLYTVKNGDVKTVSDPSMSASSTMISPDGKYAITSLSTVSDPYQIWIYELAKPSHSKMLEDMEGPDFHAKHPSLPKIITMTTHDGLVLPAKVILPYGFDESKKYPVHFDIYGGPDTPEVSNDFDIYDRYKWYAENGIIEVIADCRASGHNGRLGLDQIYRQMDLVEEDDFVEWAKYFQSLPYVLPDKIGIEGYSFGGMMTAILVMDHSEAFHYGIGSSGVYEWALYDTHYTERFMDTPENNPDGYEKTKVTARAKNYPVTDANYDGSVMLKLTHGTGDDNVHFQNTLKLVDALQKEGKKFELMIYPDGMHGYRGYQGKHFTEANHAFWLKYLCGR
jgi:dipeptidyl-peptidase-4